MPPAVDIHASTFGANMQQDLLSSTWADTRLHDALADDER